MLFSKRPTEELLPQEEYALNWLDQHGFTYSYKNFGRTKIRYIVRKNGVEDILEIPIKEPDIENHMRIYGVCFGVKQTVQMDSQKADTEAIMKEQYLSESLAEEKRVPYDLLCLSLLLEHDMTCSEVAKTIRTRSDNELASFEPGVLFVLSRLIDAGVVSTHYGKPKSNRSRSPMVYHAEPAATEYMANLVNGYNKYWDAVERVISPATMNYPNL